MSHRYPFFSWQTGAFLSLFASVGFFAGFLIGLAVGLIRP